MKKEKEQRYVKLPNEMGLEGLLPKDQLVYVCLRSYMNEVTKEAFPSLNKIAKSINMSVNTVRASLDRLIKSGYITSEKRGNLMYYKFSDFVQYEPFSYEFLFNSSISFEAKAYVIASQQYMFKDIDGYGKLSLTNKELSDKINISERSIKRYDQELSRKNILDVVNNVTRDLETGCMTRTKIYKLALLGQAIIWKLKDHDKQIEELHTLVDEQNRKLAEFSSKMAKELKERDKMISSLLKERKKEQKEFKMS